jgi:DNA repair protein RadC
VNDLPPSERPRERLLRLGSEALSSQDLLAVLLGRGGAGESVMTIVQNLLVRFGNLHAISQASTEDLCTVRGIGRAKALQIRACIELAKRLQLPQSDGKRIFVRNSKEAAALVRHRLRGKMKEHFLAVLLDSRNRLIDILTVSIGSLNASIVHPREVFKDALPRSPSSIIFAHNHPSGDLTPSDNDLDVTKRLKDAGELLGVKVLDHIIISDNEHSSIMQALQP